MEMEPVLTNPAARTLRRLPRCDRDKIRAALRELCDDPYSGDTKLLEGTDGSVRRCARDWRTLIDFSTERHLDQYRSTWLSYILIGVPVGLGLVNEAAARLRHSASIPYVA
jgi:mRNA-degrading endonuclease RelE of RelBE toxin-antitoxin system